MLGALNTNQWANALNAGITGASTGVAMMAAIESSLGPIGLILGAATLGISLWQSQTNLRNERELLLSQREEITRQRNRYINSAKQSINAFRSDFDSTYGEGMYDTYDDLFTKILNLPAGGTVSDILESLSLDNVSGVVNTEIGDRLTAAAMTGAISASDVNSRYLQYMQETIRNGETAIGLQFQQQTQKETSLINSYNDNINQYNLALAEQFSNAFLQQRTANVGLASDMGEASTAQAASGFRQMGGGQNLTAIQQYQQDISNAAYYSTLNFAIRQYEGQMGSMNRGYIEQIAAIRNENAILTEQFTSQFFSQMNSYYSNLTGVAGNIMDAEESIDVLNQDIREHSAAIWFDGRGNNVAGEMHETMEDIF